MIKPSRDEIDEIERKCICDKWRKYTTNSKTHVHLIMDNEKWHVPTTTRETKHVKALKMRFHVLKKCEGPSGVFHGAPPGETPDQHKRQCECPRGGHQL